jgi:predicted transcriptional regulator
MAESTFTFHVDESLKSEFTTAARAGDRDGADLLREYMRDFVRRQGMTDADHDTWFERQVRAGQNAANAGEVISAEEVEAELAQWRATTGQTRRCG